MMGLRRYIEASPGKKANLKKILKNQPSTKIFKNNISAKLFLAHSEILFLFENLWIHQLFI